MSQCHESLCCVWLEREGWLQSQVGAEKKNSKHGSAAGGSTPKTRVKGAVASKDSTIVDGDHTLVKVVDKEPPKPVRKMTRSTGQLRNGQREGDGDGVKEESRKEVGWGREIQGRHKAFEKAVNKRECTCKDHTVF